MANSFLNPVVIAKDLLVRFENNLVMAKMVSREFESEFAVPNQKCGYTMNARVPVRFRGTEGDAFHAEDVKETMVPITIDKLWGTHMEISDQDLTLSLDRIRERYLESASQTVANKVDVDGCRLYLDLYNFAGVPGTIPATLTTYTDAGVVLANHGCPETETQKAVVVNPRMQAGVLGFNSNIFNPAKTISDQYLTGKMGVAVGFRFSMDQNVQRHRVGNLGTSGAPTSNPIVAGANQSGAVLNTSGWDAGTSVLRRGDIIAVAGMNGVNPISYQDTGELRTFNVTADVVADAGGLAAIPIDPPINADPTDTEQTVTNLPAANAVLRVFNQLAATFGTIDQVSTPQALAFHKDCFTLAIVKQELPGGVEWSEQVMDKKAGLALRLTRAWDPRTNRKLTRVEALGGWKTIRKELGCRICG